MRSSGIGTGFSVMGKAMEQQGLGLQVLIESVAGLGADTGLATASPAAAELPKQVRAAAGIGRSIDTVV